MIAIIACKGLSNAMKHGLRNCAFAVISVDLRCHDDFMVLTNSDAGEPLAEMETGSGGLGLDLCSSRWAKLPRTGY